MYEVIRVLALEDDEENSKALFRVMEVVYKDVDFKLAKNYEEALDLYTSHDFDLLLVDLDLRNSSKQGWEFIVEIRSENPEAVIFVLTGIEYEGIIPEPDFKKKYKVRHWLRKPIAAGALAECIYREFRGK